MRVNGKNWHAPRKAFRPVSSSSASISKARKPSSAPATNAFEVRRQHTASIAATKATEQALKTEKEEERQRRISAIRERREAKAEKERYAKMEERMHKKRVERLKRREKRNKLLKS